MEKYTIKQLSEGEVAAKNDGTLEQTQKLMNLAFPEDSFIISESSFISYSKFFYLSPYSKGRWTHGSKTDLPTQSVEDFLDAEWKPKRGDDVLVKDEVDTIWSKRTFITEIDGCVHPYVTVNSSCEVNFREGLGFGVDNWDEMKQLPFKEPKIEFSVMVNGQETKLSLEKSEWDKLMSLNEKK